MNTTLLIPSAEDDVNSALCKKGAKRRAFTLLELMVVVAIISILALLVIPGLSKVKKITKGTSCKNNLRQLQMACLMYGGDHRGRLPGNQSTDESGVWRSLPESWCGPSNATLEGDQDNLREGQVFQYISLVITYHCPADESVFVKYGTSGLPGLRARSVSLNGSLNGRTNGFQKVITSFEEARRPSEMFSFIDEAEISIDDGHFLVTQVEKADAFNAPARRHDKRTALAFVDGHCDLELFPLQPFLRLKEMAQP